MKNPITTTASLALCAAIAAALTVYSLNRDYSTDQALASLEHELRQLESEVETLATAQPLIPIEQQWLIAQAIVNNYAGVELSALAEQNQLSDNKHSDNGWHAVLSAPPDLLLPLARLLQERVPLKVLEVRLDSKQGLLLILILGAVT